MTQESKEETDVVKESKSDVSKSQEKVRRGHAFKIVIRRLPPSMSESDFFEQVSPLPEYDSFYFTYADRSMSGNSFARAYISIRSQQDILQLKERWDGYVFLDERGQEYPAMVEFAPFQKMPPKKPKKPDSKCGTLEHDYLALDASRYFAIGEESNVWSSEDSEYMKFLETMDVEEDIDLPSMETTVEKLEKRDRELKANNGVPNVVTPLIEYVLAKKMEKFRIREEKREVKRKKEAERKKTQDEKRRQRRLSTATKINKDGVLRDESEEEVTAVSDEESRSEGQKKEKFRTAKTQIKTAKSRQVPPNRDRNFDEEPGLSARPRAVRHFPDREANNRQTKHRDDELKVQRKAARSNEADEFHDEDRPPTRRERRAPRNADREKNINSTIASTSKDPIGPLSELLEKEIPDRPDRPERRDKLNRKDRPGEKKPRLAKKDDRQIPKKKPLPKPQSKRYSDIRPGAQERQQSLEESRESTISNEGAENPSKSRNQQRISKLRNKDRPAQEIYRPGQRKKSEIPDEKNNTGVE